MSESQTEVREGYRMTELGELPHEWRVATIGDVAHVNREGCDPRREFGDGRFTYVDISSVSENAGGITETTEIIASEAPSRARRVMRAGDVIMSTVRPYLKAFALVGAEYDGDICSTGFAVLSAKSDATPAYLLYTTLSSVVQEQFTRQMRGANYPALNAGHVKETLIPLPPLSEQQKIAAVLDAVQTAKQRTEAVIQAARELKKSLLQYLFTYGPVPVDQAEDVELHGTEGGEAPATWGHRPLGDLLELIRNGTTARQNRNGEGLPVSRIETISRGQIDLATVGYTTELPVEQIDRFRLDAGDILFSHINSEPLLGNAALYTGRPVLLIHGMNLLRIKPCQETLRSRFLQLVFEFYRSRGVFVRMALRSVGQSSINQSRMKALMVPAPPLSVQDSVIAILDSLDTKIAVEEDRKKALDLLFHTLLNDLMTARIRVADLDLGA